jgi:hypothetical protein
MCEKMEPSETSSSFIKDVGVMFIAVQDTELDGW